MEVRNPCNGVTRGLAAVAILLISQICSIAAAQGTPLPDERIWHAPSMDPTRPGTRSARHVHAHADRVLLAPTAETHPEGTVYLTAYEVVLPSVGYAFTDRLQATVTGFTDFEGGFFDLTVKANVLRSRWLRVATHGSVDFILPDNEAEDDDAIDLLVGRAGGTLQLCFELACRSSVSVSVTLVAHDAADTLLPVGLAAGFTARASSWATLLLEYSTLLNASRDLPLIDLPVYLLSYGMRIDSDRAWALDLALMRVLSGDSDLHAGDVKAFDLLGVPLLVFTWRFL